MNKFLMTIAAVAILPSIATAQSWPAPTLESKPGSRWWVLGSAWDKPNIKWNMQQYAEHGLGTLEITPLYGVKGNDRNNIPFLSTRWMQMLKFIEQQGERDSIQIDMATGTGWPFGGPEVKISEAACKVIFVDDTITAQKKKSVINLDIRVKSANDAPYARLQRVMAYSLDGKGTIDITSHASRGMLSWRPKQKGTWRIIALYAGRTRQKVKRAAPGGEGYVIDHFDSTVVANYLRTFDRAFLNSGTPFPHAFFNDSYEVYGADWTPSLLKVFERRRGYKLEEHLPALIDPFKKGTTGAEEAKVLSDYRETLGEMLLHNFTEQWTRWAHSHGALTRNQAHGSPANLIDIYSAVDIPEIESFGLTDFGIKGLRKDPGMTRPNFSDLSMLKYASSAAHINAKKYTSSETFTWLTEHFRTSLSQMKPDMDLMFCSGVNRMFFHGTCYSPKNDPWPGWKFYASIDMSPTNSIWRDATFFTKYIERCQSFLQMGEPDNDFLVYLPVRDMWARPDKSRLMQFDIHSMGRKAPEFKKMVLELDSLGYDCDYISDNYLMKTGVKNGKPVTAAGMTYKGVIIPLGSTLTPDMMSHIANMQALGATIIIGNDMTTLSKAATPETLRTEFGMKVIRRRNDKGYHFFIANLTPKDVDDYIKPTIPFKDAIWFDPLDGRRYAAQVKDGKIRVAMRSGESMILQTFNEHLNDSITKSLTEKPTIPENPTVIDITNNRWTLGFIDEEPKVDTTYVLNKLCSWENLDNNNVRTTMGTGSYITQFNVTKKQAKGAKGWFIDLGDVRESARVYLNGRFIGCAWSVPYTLDLGNAVHEGVNTLRIDVTNLPANRIADLDRRGVKWRKFNEINVVDLNYKKTTYSNWAPVPSGLNSTVKLIKY